MYSPGSIICVIPVILIYRERNRKKARENSRKMCHSWVIEQTTATGSEKDYKNDIEVPKVIQPVKLPPK